MVFLEPSRPESLLLFFIHDGGDHGEAQSFKSGR
jgi:hypothetical protein